MGVVLAATTSDLRPSDDGGDDSASWANTVGTSCSGASCYLEVDESSGASCSNSDGATSYVESSTNGASQTFDIDESSIPDDATITNIAITACYAKGTGAAGSFQTRYCHNGSCSDSGSSLSGSGSYAEATQNHTVSFTKTSGSDIEIGVTQTSSSKNIRISQISTVITYTEASDTADPSAVSDLALSGATETSLDLSWTAPGDDGSTGTATSYDVRYSTSNITDLNWSSATQATGEPTPSVAGSSENLTVSGLSAGTTYYFAIKTSDEVPNESTISNVPSGATSAVADTTAPSAVSDLGASGAGQTSVNLTWTAPGDNAGTGTATSYDVRYSTSNITEGNWSSATQATGEPTPSVAGSSEALTVSSLSANTTYYFAIKTSDEVPNESSISNIYSITTTATPDTTAPSAVSDLALSGATESSIDLSWTAPGDDAGTGTATSYDVRYSLSVIDASNFDSAVQATGEPTPSVAGSSESLTVSGLSAETTYYFAIKTSDEVPNESVISNVPSGATSAASSGGGDGGSTNTEGSAGEPRWVRFLGQAFPESTISVLWEDNLVFRNVPLETFTIDENGYFDLLFNEIIGGQYIFVLEVKDKDGVKADPIPFVFDLHKIQKGQFKAEGIFVSPTVNLEHTYITQGNILNIGGYASPKSSVEISLDDDSTNTVVADDTGKYISSVDTGSLILGDHFIKIRQSVTDGRISSYTSPRFFKVSELSFPRADLNSDNIINIVDWSTFLFRWGSEDVDLKSLIDLNDDGETNIVDLSIFLKHMTI